MAGWLQALILGVVQGLTEFLPVSSSGHLVLAQIWLGEQFLFLQQAVAFDLVLHVGTLLPVLYFYRRDVVEIARAPFRDRPSGYEGPGAWLQADRHRWLAAMVVVAMVPTGLMGIGLKDLFEALFHDARAVCGALFFTGCLLYATRFFGARVGSPRALGVGTALLIGLAQGFAITPGISRSGSTIAVALLLGMDRDLAARFSFLLSIPAILGALVLVAKDGVSIEPTALPALAVGFVASMVTGYAALVMLVALVKRGGLHRFAFYLWPVAVLAWFTLAGGLG